MKWWLVTFRLWRCFVFLSRLLWLAPMEFTQWGWCLLSQARKLGTNCILLIFLEQNITSQITQIILFPSQVLQMLFHQSPLDFCTVGWFDIYWSRIVMMMIKNITISMIMIFIMVQAWPTSPLLSCHFNQHCRNGPALQHDDDDDFMTIMVIIMTIMIMIVSKDA